MPASGLRFRCRQVRSLASANASKIADFIRENGASFFEEIVEGTHLLRAQVEDGSFGACGVGAGELG